MKRTIKTLQLIPTKLIGVRRMCKTKIRTVLGIKKLLLVSTRLTLVFISAEIDSFLFFYYIFRSIDIFIHMDSFIKKDLAFVLKTVTY
jgi:hypothetical protein